MPNFATNHVAITGTPEQIDTLVERAITKREGQDVAVLDFEKIVPCPPELRDTVSPAEVVPTQSDADMVNAAYAGIELSHSGQAEMKAISQAEADRRRALYGDGVLGRPVLTWYEFCTLYWGTKWPALGASTFERARPGQLNLVFATAWTQPEPIYRALEATFGVTVHARAIIEGGFPDEEYGDPEDHMLDVRTIEFR